MHRMPIVVLTMYLAMGVPLSASAQSLPDLDTSLARAKCKEDWTKRGNLDNEMFNYCMGRQSEGYDAAMTNLNRYAQVPLIDAIVKSAVNTWLKPHDYQYEMVAYQIEREGEAYLDTAYGVQSGTYSEAQVAICVEQWLKPSEPQWTMVAYCLEQ
jgi:hypothetical protein